MDHRRHIVVVGAGIVGVSTALWLQRDGHRVTLIDRDGPAAGASQGNAGLLAAASIVPVTTPGLLTRAPRMLASRRQPLFLRWSYLPQLAPWLIRYLRHANQADAERTAAALAPLLGDSLDQHQALARGTGAERWVVPCDYCVLYRDRAAFRADGLTWHLRRAHGWGWEELEGAAWRSREPVFDPRLGFAVRLGEHGRITDPGAYVRALAAHLEREGGRVLRAEVTGFDRADGRVTAVQAGGAPVACDAAVITTGAWSGALMRQLGLSVPLETERGYHVELWQPSAMPRDPVMLAEAKVVATPMEGRLRLAGVVEFGGLAAGPSRAPLDFIRRRLREVLPGLTWDRQTEWMGHRPATANSVPLIGAVPDADGLFAGFGHHHVGLTGGAKTGRLLAQMVSGTRPNIDMAPYDPARYAAA